MRALLPRPLRWLWIKKLVGENTIAKRDRETHLSRRLGVASLSPPARLVLHVELLPAGLYFPGVIVPPSTRREPGVHRKVGHMRMPCRVVLRVGRPGEGCVGMRVLDLLLEGETVSCGKRGRRKRKKTHGLDAS